MFTTIPNAADFHDRAARLKVSGVLACPLQKQSKGLPEDSPVVVRTRAAGEHHHPPMPRYRVDAFWNPGRACSNLELYNARLLARVTNVPRITALPEVAGSQGK